MEQTLETRETRTSHALAEPASVGGQARFAAPPDAVLGGMAAALNASPRAQGLAQMSATLQGRQEMRSLGSTRARTSQLVRQPAAAIPPSAQPAIQRTIYNMGDDTALAARDGGRLEKKLGQPYVEIPIPELRGDGMLAEASDPFVVMFHGRTLKQMGAPAFRDLLISKGYPRSKGLELVLITCDADQVLGAEPAQGLADELQSVVRVAKGKVQVQSDGTPYVIVKREGHSDVTHMADIFDEFFKEFNDGWTKYEPQPQATLAIIRGEAQKQNERAGEMQTTLKGLVEKAGQVGYGGAPLNSLSDQVEAMCQATAEVLQQGASFADSATNESMRSYRRIVDQQESSLRELEREVIRMRLQVELSDAEMVPGEGWGDFDLGLSGLDDAGGESEAVEVNHIPLSGGMAEDSVASLRARPGTAGPVQRTIEDTTQQPTANGRTLSQIAANFSDINLVTADATLNLRLSFETMEPYGRTRLYANDTQVPFDHITPETANETYTISIALNREFYTSGQNAEAMGSLVETLTHEWDLHGLQLARNIVRARQGQAADLKIDHQALFSPVETDLDRDIAAQITDGTNEAFGPRIYQSYINDVRTHQGVADIGWTGDDISKGEALSTDLIALRTATHALTTQLNSGAVQSLDVFKGAVDELENMFEFDMPITLPYEGLDRSKADDVRTGIELITALSQAAAPDPSPEQVTALLALLPQTLRLLREFLPVLDGAGVRRAILVGLGVPTEQLQEPDEGEDGGGDDHGVDFAASYHKMN
jgi:hypothetical protein